MKTTILSSKYQVLIPKAVRTDLKLGSSMKFDVLPYEGRIILIPISSIKKMRGFLNGIDTNISDETEK